MLFSPVKLGSLTLEQRTWVPAMVPWRSNEDGFVTDDVLDWYERFARGQPGAIVIEATGIRDIPSGPLLRIGDDRFIPGLKELADTVRSASDGKTRLLIQMIDFLTIRRRPDPGKYFSRFLAITDSHREKLSASGWPEERIRAHLAGLPEKELDEILTGAELESLRMGYRERVTDMHLPHVKDLPQVLPELFAQATRRAREAGIDGVELHYAHAYTMASFLSATNARPDGYGGGREQRARLPLEVFRHVRRTVGEDYCVGCRFLSDECIDGGNTVDDASISPLNLPGPAWISSPCPGGASSMTPNNHWWAGPLTLTRGEAVMNACPGIFQMISALLAGTWNPLHRLKQPSTGQAMPPR